MTEQEWLTSSDPARMLGLATGKTCPAGRAGNFSASDRKLQLVQDAVQQLSPPWRSLDDFYERDDRPFVANLIREIIGNPWRPYVVAETQYAKTLKEYQILDLNWLTPTVVSLAAAAYQERGRRCDNCKGMGEIRSGHPLSWKDCPVCGDLGRIESGQLDNARLAVIADALEDAGCPEIVDCEQCNGQGGWELRGWTHDSWDQCGICLGKGCVPNPILTHLRSDGVHVRGMWSLDVLLNKT